MQIESLLQLMLDKDGSDLFITEGRPPGLKANGKIHNVGKSALTSQETRDIALSTMEEWQKEEFWREKEINYALMSKQGGRFRVNAFFQRGAVGMVLRKIPADIPSLEELGLPPTLKELCMNKRGIIIFVGGTGTGKTTSLASLIDYRNEHGSGHIITVEDPIEFVHEHKGCIITQRELGIDTLSWENALQSTLRQTPDVILIGEIRSQESMEHAISFAETGHLVFATLHANNANQAFDRVINFFPADRREQLLLDLSLNLRAFIAQQLIPTSDGGRCAAVEVLINSPLIGDLIKKGEVHEIKEIMSKSKELGMQTFDQALYELYNEGVIEYEEAIKHADSKNDLRLLIKLHSSRTAQPGEGDETDGLMLEEAEDSRNNGRLY